MKRNDFEEIGSIVRKRNKEIKIIFGVLAFVNVSMFIVLFFIKLNILRLIVSIVVIVFDILFMYVALKYDKAKENLRKDLEE